MTNLRSLLLRLECDCALRAHGCQRNKKHKIVKGAKRLKVRLPSSQLSADHYCVDCARAMIKASIETLKALELEFSD